LQELEALNEDSSKEAALHFLMGKIYKRLNLSDRALASFSLAQELDAKSGPTIKLAIDAVDKPNDPSDEVLELL